MLNLGNVRERLLEVENTLSKKIDTAGQNASYDAYCRNLLVNKQILACILKTCVKEFYDCPVKDIEENENAGCSPVRPDIAGRKEKDIKR